MPPLVMYCGVIEGRAMEDREIERRVRASCRDEAMSVLARLHHLAADISNREVLTLAELKALGAAEETLREIARRLS